MSMASNFERTFRIYAQDEIWFIGSGLMNDGGLLFIALVIVGAVITWCWGVSTLVIGWL